MGIKFNLYIFEKSYFITKWGTVRDYRFFVDRRKNLLLIQWN